MGHLNMCSSSISSNISTSQTLSKAFISTHTLLRSIAHSKGSGQLVKHMHVCKCIVLKNNKKFLAPERRISESVMVYDTFTSEDENTGGKDCWDKQLHRTCLS